MDAVAQDAMRAHYESHANKHQSSMEAERARRAGGAFQLKKFHNDIKRALINRFAYGKDALLDLACGRGGDIRKWADAKIKYVKGIDLSPGEIVEAQKRFSELLQQQTHLGLRAEFVDSPELGQSEWRETRSFDAVTIMFAVHYFFASEQALRLLLHNVSINLKDGGMFFGTVPDGKRVLAALNRQPVMDSPMLQLSAQTFCEEAACARQRRKPGEPCAAHGKAAPQAFGSAYTCAIGDTVTAGHGDSLGSFEYLVYESVFRGMAASFDLEPVTDLGPALDHFFDEADAPRIFKHFHPAFRDADPSLGTASALFMAFAFRKRGAPPAPPPAASAASPAVSPAAAAQEPLKRPHEQAASDEQQPPAKKRVSTGPALKRPAIRRRGGKPLEPPPGDAAVGGKGDGGSADADGQTAAEHQAAAADTQ